jgi:hypothetical protein
LYRGEVTETEIGPIIEFGTDLTTTAGYFRQKEHPPKQCMDQNSVNNPPDSVVYPLEAVLYGCGPVEFDDE